MATRKCCKCKKEITTGKYYHYFTGKKNGVRLARYQGTSKGDFWCPLCADKEKINNLFGDNLIEIEWEIGNQVDEEITEFEEKWQKYYSHNPFTKKDADTNEKIILAWCQEAKRELEHYLQKPEIVEKSFGGKIKGYGSYEMSFYYLFAKSARQEKYRQEVVEPTIAKILGVEKLDQEINTVNEGASPGVPGYTGGQLKNLKINNNHAITYCWIDGSEGDCRRIVLRVIDPQLALQSFCRALTIKEQELTGELPKPNRPDNSEPNNPPPNNPPSPVSPNNNSLTNQPKSPNWTLIIVLGIAGILAILGLVIYFLKKPKSR